MRNFVPRKNNPAEVSPFDDEEGPTGRGFHRREHPQKEELERFKREFKAWEKQRVQDSVKGKGIIRQIANPDDRFRFPELNFDKRVDRSPSPTRIVILQPTCGINEEIEGVWPWPSGTPTREDARERLKSGVKAKGKHKIRREKLQEAAISSGCRPRNMNGRKSTGSKVKEKPEIETWSFRSGSGGPGTNLGRCFSEPISGAALSRVLPREHDLRDNGFESTTEEKKPKKDVFDLKWRIQNLRRALTLGGKLFRRKNQMKDDPVEIASVLPSIKLHGKDNSTEVPPSPASRSTFSDSTNQWKPSFMSPVSPLEVPFNDDLPEQLPEETSSHNPEVQEPSVLHSGENLKLDETKYLRRILLTAGFYNQPLNLILALCYSLTEPLAEWIFNIVETDYSILGKGNEYMNSAETLSSRRMLFHLLNEQLLCLMNTKEFSSMRRRPLRSGKELTACLWERIEKCIGLIKGKSISLDRLISDDVSVDHWIPRKGFDDVGEALEGMILCQLVDEFVNDLC